MTGTAWTEPGQGATVKDLVQATRGDPAIYHAVSMDCPLRKEARRLNSMTVYAAKRGWERRTNLALTGEPLTAEDVKRIAEAK